MKLSGIVLDVKLLRRLSKYSFNELKQLDLQGLEEFGNFKFSSLRPIELYNALQVFTFLDSYIFNYSLEETHKFIFSFRNEFTEFDLVTSLANDNGETIFVDIELKNNLNNPSELVLKLEEQINKRITDHLYQTFKDKVKCLVIGFLNNSFFKGRYEENDRDIYLEDQDSLKDYLSSFNKTSDVKSFLYQMSNLQTLVKLAKDLKNDKYRYYRKTDLTYETILNKLNTNDVVICYGVENTGKTILALRLFFSNPKFKLLILNTKLYYALDLGDSLYSSRTSYKVEDLLNTIKPSDTLIIDEAERLSLEELNKILEKTDKLILFGNNRLAYKEDMLSFSSVKLREYLKNNYHLKVGTKLISTNPKYLDPVIKSLSYLTNQDTTPTPLPLNYEVDLYLDEDKFLSDFEAELGLKKIYITENHECEEITIANRNFKVTKEKDSFFLPFNLNDDTIGTTSKALSYKIEHNYLYLDDTIITKFNNKKSLFSCNIKKTKLNHELYLNELNILLTRGTKSLNIYTKDLACYLYLSKLIKQIKSK